jgi:hypothetical protein
VRTLAVFCLLAACGGSGGGNPPGDDDQQADAPMAGNPDAPPPPPGFIRLIGRSWSLPAGATDTYLCVNVTVPTDTYITNIIAQAPIGTHHTVLTFASGNAQHADGEYNCSVSTLGMVMLYASGVGTDQLDFPTDVAVKIAAGTQISLNLHLFNATDNPISGDTAILVKAQSTPPPTLAEMVFVGGFLFNIPSDNQQHDFAAGCTENQTYNSFAVWPHMHKLGVHQKFERIRGGVSTVIHDDAFTFNEQKYYLQSPEFDVQSGDQLKTTCSWVNNTGTSVHFGESTLDEMCFTGVYRYPAAGEGLFKCTDTKGQGF